MPKSLPKIGLKCINHLTAFGKKKRKETTQRTLLNGRKSISGKDSIVIAIAEAGIETHIATLHFADGTYDV